MFPWEVILKSGYHNKDLLFIEKNYLILRHALLKISVPMPAKFRNVNELLEYQDWENMSSLTQ